MPNTTTKTDYIELLFDCLVVIATIVVPCLNLCKVASSILTFATAFHFVELWSFGSVNEPSVSMWEARPCFPVAS